LFASSLTSAARAVVTEGSAIAVATVRASTHSLHTLTPVCTCTHQQRQLCMSNESCLADYTSQTLARCRYNYCSRRRCFQLICIYIILNCTSRYMTPIIPTRGYLARLWNLIEPTEVLEKHGFVSQPLTDGDLLLKRRCTGCNKGNILFETY
jgi:hypothetical protein